MRKCTRYKAKQKCGKHVHMQDDLNYNKLHRRTMERNAPRPAQLPQKETETHKLHRRAMERNAPRPAQLPRKRQRRANCTGEQWRKTRQGQPSYPGRRRRRTNCTGKQWREMHQGQPSYPGRRRRLWCGWPQEMLDQPQLHSVPRAVRHRVRASVIYAVTPRCYWCYCSL